MGLGETAEQAFADAQMLAGEYLSDPRRPGTASDAATSERSDVAIVCSLRRNEGGSLRFAGEAVRARRDNMLLIRSLYEQPFGTFTGSLPGGIELAEGYGVMERHVAVW